MKLQLLRDVVARSEFERGLDNNNNADKDVIRVISIENEGWRIGHGCSRLKRGGEKRREKKILEFVIS